MNNSAYHGHVTPAKDLTRLLPGNRREAYEEALKELELDEALGILEENLPHSLPGIESLYTLGDDDESSDLAYGEVYALFRDADLFVTAKSLEHQYLNTLGVTLEEASWVTFG